MKKCLIVSVILDVLLFTQLGHTFERQHHIGIGAGLSLLSINDKSTLDIGTGIGASYTYGITDQFNLMVEGASSIVALGENRASSPTSYTHPAAVSSFGAGLSYVLDVIRWVPYFGGLAGGYVLSGGGLDKAVVIGGVQAALGLDYQLTRKLAVGVAIRQHFLLTDLKTYPSFTTAFLRAEYVWGF